MLKSSTFLTILLKENKLLIKIDKSDLEITKKHFISQNMITRFARRIIGYII
ncbi:hypothetical protein VCRA2128O305_90053 [Vibrio crassostreae]|nr:hypothetical protein VCRA2110O113_110051 [Vibrio crassostreae]CAK1803591.1 hypothetical protein VCRA2117O380_160055 [Vibrio crassostreae]CAK1806278.1 hypothetical protein VCRA2118O236_190022 [Vibrio crassostreae]CAK1808780.1 hypothetical protein VCRA2119O245_190052 [Vibrio crassostreae]CAK1812763.1 hypothetical protein VCRA2113O228_170089 [Vibrio crassostreae]